MMEAPATATLIIKTEIEIYVYPYDSIMIEDTSDRFI